MHRHIDRLSALAITGLLVGFTVGCGDAPATDDGSSSASPGGAAASSHSALLSLENADEGAVNFGFSEEHGWHFYRTDEVADKTWPAAASDGAGSDSYGTARSRLGAGSFEKALKDNSGGSGTSSGRFSGTATGSLSFSGRTPRAVGYSASTRRAGGFSGTTGAGSGNFNVSPTTASCDLVWICRFVEEVCSKFPAGAGCQQAHQCRSQINKVQFPSGGPAQGWRCFLSTLFKCATKAVDKVSASKLRNAKASFQIGLEISECVKGTLFGGQGQQHGPPSGP
ncbi:MAG: hypothetical protein ABEL76_00365 [Bradymonadaceae bacterium]